ncbi:hypothetical protein F2Q69_00062993 [Brassica cretica]|uniref:Uncharacterized protein n=1 Tax=Brassica cretica TaxID=69181 RepID=A0A8S9RKD0_BRACR|nr:hypothetical protein F2Q69_00062993 [Brassica cretica]
MKKKGSVNSGGAFAGTQNRRRKVKNAFTPRRLEPTIAELKKPPPPVNQTGGDGAVEAFTSRKRNLIWQANFTTPNPPHDRVVTTAAAPPMMTVHSPSCRRRMGTGPELRQSGQEKEAKEKQKNYLYRKNEGLRRQHARSCAGRTPDPKADLLSLSHSFFLFGQQLLKKFIQSLSGEAHEISHADMDTSCLEQSFILRSDTSSDHSSTHHHQSALSRRLVSVSLISDGSHLPHAHTI